MEERLAVVGVAVRHERRWTSAGATPARELVRSTDSHVASSSCPRATGGVKAEYASEEEVQDGSPYHKGNPAASTYGKGRAETTHILVKAMEEGKNLERTLDELHGVWGAEC